MKALIAVLVLSVACAQSGALYRHHTPSAKNIISQPVAGLSIPDIELLNQHGEWVHFYSGLVKGQIVAINTIFTSCTTICPPMGNNFSRLRKRLGDHAGRDVNLISISVDPDVDIPERLDKWSRQFGEMGPGWTLLTGPKADVDTLLKALQMFAADKQGHTPVALIGGEGAGDWVRPSALLAPARLAEIIQTKLDLMAKH